MSTWETPLCVQRISLLELAFFHSERNTSMCIENINDRIMRNNFVPETPLCVQRILFALSFALLYVGNTSMCIENIFLLYTSFLICQKHLYVYREYQRSGSLPNFLLETPLCVQRILQNLHLSLLNDGNTSMCIENILCVRQKHPLFAETPLCVQRIYHLSRNSNLSFRNTSMCIENIKENAECSVEKQKHLYVYREYNRA